MLCHSSRNMALRICYSRHIPPVTAYEALTRDKLHRAQPITPLSQLATFMPAPSLMSQWHRINGCFFFVGPEHLSTDTQPSSLASALLHSSPATWSETPSTPWSPIRSTSPRTHSRCVRPNLPITQAAAHIRRTDENFRSGPSQQHGGRGLGTQLSCARPGLDTSSARSPHPTGSDGRTKPRSLVRISALCREV